MTASAQATKAIRPKAQAGPQILCGLLSLLSLSCQNSSSIDAAPNEVQKTDTSEAASNSATTSTIVVPGNAYLGDGFAIESPERWETIDQDSIEDGSVVEALPAHSTTEIIIELKSVFGNGAVVSFYDFGDGEAEYTPNITLSRNEREQLPDTSTLATRTVAGLQEAGFGDVAYQLGGTELGEMIAFNYTVPASRSGAVHDLFGSSYVIFGQSATWTLTGLTLHSPESIDQAVSTTASTLLEL